LYGNSNFSAISRIVSPLISIFLIIGKKLSDLRKFCLTLM
jgi:hypothetical protein